MFIHVHTCIHTCRYQVDTFRVAPVSELNGMLICQRIPSIMPAKLAVVTDIRTHSREEFNEPRDTIMRKKLKFYDHRNYREIKVNNCEFNSYYLKTNNGLPEDGKSVCVHHETVA